MATRPEIDEDELTVFEVPLDDASVARLMEMSEATKTDPRVLLSALVHDVLLDDALAHGEDTEIDPKVGKYTH